MIRRVSTIAGNAWTLTDYCAMCGEPVWTMADYAGLGTAPTRASCDHVTATATTPVTRATPRTTPAPTPADPDPGDTDTVEETNDGTGIV